MSTRIHRALLAGLVGVMLSGCQTGSSFERHGEAVFQAMWSLYQQCERERNSEHLRRIAERLNRLASDTERREGELPPWIRTVMAPAPVKMAVEPRAMERDCARREGRLTAKSDAHVRGGDPIAVSAPPHAPVGPAPTTQMQDVIRFE